MGRDYTLFAKVDGVVSYERMGKDRRRVSIVPPGSGVVPAGSA
jgi:large subunit ribosomal protein L27